MLIMSQPPAQAQHNCSQRPPLNTIRVHPPTSRSSQAFRTGSRSSSACTGVHSNLAVQRLLSSARSGLPNRNLGGAGTKGFAWVLVKRRSASDSWGMVKWRSASDSLGKGGHETLGNQASSQSPRDLSLDVSRRGDRYASSTAGDGKSLGRSQLRRTPRCRSWKARRIDCVASSVTPRGFLLLLEPGAEGCPPPSAERGSSRLFCHQGTQLRRHLALVWQEHSEAGNGRNPREVRPPASPETQPAHLWPWR